MRSSIKSTLSSSASHDRRMSSLLNLPLELRAAIIEDALSSVSQAPASPSKVGRVRFIDVESMVQPSMCGVYHEQRKPHCPSNSLPLLLTNHQISTEARWVIQTAKELNYVLDLPVLNEVDLFPTWLSVPWISNQVDTLTIDVRLFGHILYPNPIYAPRRSRECVKLDWGFFTLLERFLRHGPVSEKNVHLDPCSAQGFPKYDGRDVHVRTLILDFRSAKPSFSFPPESLTYQQWYAIHAKRDFLSHIRQRPATVRVDLATPPEWLADYIRDELTKVLSMDYFTLRGQILYERIGSIRLLVDGALYHEFDLAGQLAALQFTDSQYTISPIGPEERDTSFWAWKKHMLESRSRYGLRVVMAQDKEM